MLHYKDTLWSRHLFSYFSELLIEQNQTPPKEVSPELTVGDNFHRSV